MTDHLPEVERLVAMGFAVVEVAPPRDDGTCSCRYGAECPSPGKHPVGRAWLKRALKNRTRARGDRVPAHARHAPVTSYGLVPPPGSGLIVIDRDDPSVKLPMPATLEVTRPSAPPGKAHYYFRLADGISEDDVPRVFGGGEVRVAGSGHVVGPGCRHVSGDLYVSNGADVGYADRELIDGLVASPAIRRGTQDHGEVDAVAGTRHAFLVGQARKLRGFGHDAEQIAEELREINDEYCMPPLDERAAEFGRMAEWAARNVEPDRTLVARPRSRRRTAWEVEVR